MFTTLGEKKINLIFWQPEDIKVHVGYYGFPPEVLNLFLEK